MTPRVSDGAVEGRALGMKVLVQCQLSIWAEDGVDHLPCNGLESSSLD